MAEKVLLLSNPRRRKAAKKSPAKRRKVTARKKNPAKRQAPRAAAKAARVTRRRRKNPSPRGIMDKNLMPSIKAAGGAVAIDMAYNLIPIPAEYQSGMTGAVVKGLATIGIGMGLEKTKVVKAPMARDLVNGSLTVQLYTIMQELVGSVAAGGAAPTDQGTGYIATARDAGQLGYITETPNYETTLGMLSETEEEVYSW